VSSCQRVSCVRVVRVKTYHFEKESLHGQFRQVFRSSGHKVWKEKNILGRACAPFITVASRHLEEAGVLQCDCIARGGPAIRNPGLLQFFPTEKRHNYEYLVNEAKSQSRPSCEYDPGPADTVVVCMMEINKRGNEQTVSNLAVAMTHVHRLSSR
jgi:hypothetical protein